MSYIGNQPTSVAFLTDQFSGNGSTTVFTMSVAPATTSSILVAITGVVQDPSTYSVSGTTLTFSAAPPSGTGNISVRYLGIPASGVATTAYRTVTEFTATAGQTTFTPPSYTVGYINVYMNGVLLGSADYTATNGTTVVLASGAVLGALITTESFYVSSVLNAIPATPGSVVTSYIANGAVGAAQIATGGITPTQLDTQSQYTGFKNRIINGAMQIDQRNAGAALTTTNGYPVDRWIMEDGCDAVLSGQRTTDVPSGAGFVNSLKVTATTADASIGSTQFAVVTQIIEGFNTADFMMGTASASSFTVSFWVKASVTGTYSCTVYNAGASRINPQPYTINVANTWEYKTVTFTGDTSGTWVTDAGRGIVLNFYIALGSSYLGAAGWNGSNIYGITGQANALASTNNIFAITGVQLEKGSTATSFDYRPYGQELMLAQRYYYRISNNSANSLASFATGVVAAATQIDRAYSALPVTMRSAPTIGINSLRNYDGVTASAVTSVGSNFSTTTVGSASFVNSGGGLGVGRQGMVIENTSSAYLEFSAEL